MWVTKLLIFPVEIRIFAPKQPNLAQNWHFWSIWARPCRPQCPVGGSVGGCGARAVSRKTPIYFIYIQPSSYLHHQHHHHYLYHHYEYSQTFFLFTLSASSSFRPESSALFIFTISLRSILLTLPTLQRLVKMTCFFGFAPKTENLNIV